MSPPIWTKVVPCGWLKITNRECEAAGKGRSLAPNGTHFVTRRVSGTALAAGFSLGFDSTTPVASAIPLNVIAMSLAPFQTTFQTSSYGDFVRPAELSIPQS